MSSNHFKSRLPDVATSIFTEMSLLANQSGAINLSQGFPEFDTPEFLKAAVIDAVQQGKNQYAPSSGLPPLLEQISALINRRYQYQLDPHKNITITSGATEAIFVAIQTIVHAGDEVIIFDPAYDSYAPVIQLAGGRSVHIPLSAPDYKVNWQQVQESVTDRTRAIIVNSPHNPTGTLLDHQDMLNLQQIVCDNDLFLISDEVYEFITFDKKAHQSVLKYPELFERAFVVSSFGKTFHCTGWKMGYCSAPEYLTNEFRKIHQYVTYSVHTPSQIGITNMLTEHPEHIDELGTFYQQKRDYLIGKLASSKFKILPSSGTYFLLVDYSNISDMDDRSFCHWLTTEVGVAAIPLSPFYEQPNTNKVIRLCFAKNEATLDLAAEKLCQL
ncbi:aminotransferase class I/II-fold pyridoxal phosphate-dependent enzyme [Alteromonadaceae bacterium M269]|nr:aminotransferase class I/II-fold pyridoxal phosphate-dependent enzyme [Alteromonadaceae bacterium M269]